VFYTPVDHIVNNFIDVQQGVIPHTSEIVEGAGGKVVYDEHRLAKL
jgi:hypothetical protein